MACCDEAGAKPPSDIAVDNNVMGRRIRASDNGYTSHEDIIVSTLDGIAEMASLWYYLYVM